MKYYRSNPRALKGSNGQKLTFCLPLTSVMNVMFWMKCLNNVWSWVSQYNHPLSSISSVKIYDCLWTHSAFLVVEVSSRLGDPSH